MKMKMKIKIFQCLRIKSAKFCREGSRKKKEEEEARCNAVWG